MPNSIANKELTPFLKWAGGKRWLTRNYDNLFPNKFNRYIEPFLGGGAAYFHIQPNRAILNDINADLIETYRAIKENHLKVEQALRRHQRFHCQQYYYEERSRVRRSPTERAAQFLYLNRTCWNGLYRVNLSGKFNVPIGTKQSVILESDNFADIARLLRTAKLSHIDFEPLIDEAKSNDFLFIDPPYVVNHNYNGFLKYNEKLFSWADQIRLRDSLERAVSRGCKVLVLNANHKSIRDLYRGIGTPIRLPRHSVLAAKSTYRKPSSEIAIATYL